jgi:hypothetical protein
MAVDLEEGEFVPGEGAPDEEDPGIPERPDATDVYMPPVDMTRFDRLAYATIHPPHAAPGDNIRDALVAQAGKPRVTFAPSSYGAMLLFFDSHALREAATGAAPFVGQEHTVILKRHEQTANRFHFEEHEALISIAISDYPLEHWNRERIVFAVGPYANPHHVDPICLQGVDYSAVLLQVKAEVAADIPLSEYFNNHSGLAALARVSITDVDFLEDSGSDGSGPDSRGPAAPGGGPAPAAPDGSAPAPPEGPSAHGPGGAGGRLSIRDIQSVPVGRLRGSTILPTVDAQPLLTKPDSVDITLCAGSYYIIRVTGPNNYSGVYKVPLQPTRSDLRPDQGMLVVNLCTASVGFLHRVFSVGAAQCAGFSTDVLCVGPGPLPAASLPLKDAERLCDGAPLPRGAAPASLDAPPTPPPAVLTASTSADPVVAVSDDAAPVEPAPAEDPVLHADPALAASDGSASSPSFGDFDLDIPPCNSADSVRTRSTSSLTSSFLCLPRRHTPWSPCTAPRSTSTSPAGSPSWTSSHGLTAAGAPGLWLGSWNRAPARQLPPRPSASRSASWGEGALPLLPLLPLRAATALPLWTPATTTWMAILKTSSASGGTKGGLVGATAPLSH